MLQVLTKMFFAIPRSPKVFKTNPLNLEITFTGADPEKRYILQKSINKAFQLCR